MKKEKSRLKSKSFIAMLIILGMVLSVIPFKVFANNSYTITFTVQEGTSHEMKIDGGHLKIDDQYVDPREATDYSVTLENGVATITINDGTATTLNFNSRIPETEIGLYSLFVNGNEINNGTNFSGNTEIQIQNYVEHTQGDGDDGVGEHNEDNTQNHQGNATATLNYKVTGDIEYDEEMGTGVGFQINGITYKMDDQKAQFTEGPCYERDENGQLLLDENDNPIPVKDPDTLEPMNKKTGVTITGDTIKYDNDASTNKVNFNFVTSWNTVIESIEINGVTVENLPQTKEELAGYYRNQAIEIPVNDIANATSYDIEIVARMATKSELYMGNFLWDYNPQGYTGPEDKILNGTLTFVEAEYQGQKYTTEEEINSLGNIYNWRDAERKNIYTDEREGVGEAQFPTGTKLTVAIIPDAGYQLVDFGINGGVFEPQEEIGTYTFEIQGGNFHLQATIAQVDDVVKSKSEKVESGSIELGGEEGTMSVGTARLDVDDVELTEEQISNFEEAAEEYEIKNYLDISLFNTVFKGKETESWDTQVKDLENEATITLKLDDGVDGNEVVVVHEKHDGTYEIIPVEYDSETNTITFKTKSFSNYAIATKTAEVETTTETENTDSKETVVSENNEQSPQTGDVVRNVFIVLAVAMVMFIITLKFKGNRKVSKH